MQWLEKDGKERKGKKTGLNKEVQGHKQKGRWESRYVAVCAEERQHEIEDNRAGGKDNGKHGRGNKFTNKKVKGKSLFKKKVKDVRREM